MIEPTISIRRARRGDEEAIFALIRGLAEYERLLDQVVATQEGIGTALFGENPRVFCDLAEVDWRVVGFAFWFYNFSTFAGRHGIFLEDFFVERSWQGRGVGQALFRNLARRCRDEGLGRLEWTVLDWNTPAMSFYRASGARLVDDCRLWRLGGEALAELAAQAE